MLALCSPCPLVSLALRCVQTWRVWRIFGSAHLRIVKISNRKLLAGTGVVVLADLILVSAWQGVAPLVPVEFSRIINTDQHIFTHCSVQSTGAGMVFVILVAIEKVGLLLFGAIMAFSTVRPHTGPGTAACRLRDAQTLRGCTVHPTLARPQCIAVLSAHVSLSSLLLSAVCFSAECEGHF